MKFDWPLKQVMRNTKKPQINIGALKNLLREIR